MVKIFYEFCTIFFHRDGAKGAKKCNFIKFSKISKKIQWKKMKYSMFFISKILQ